MAPLWVAPLCPYHPFIFLPPPLLGLYVLPWMKFIIMRGCARRGKISTLFLQFCILKVKWGKNMHTFYQMGEKYKFPPLFNNFISPNMLFGHIFVPLGGGGKQKNILPCHPGIWPFNTRIPLLQLLTEWILYVYSALGIVQWKTPSKLSTEQNYASPYIVAISKYELDVPNRNAMPWLHGRGGKKKLSMVLSS